MLVKGTPGVISTHPGLNYRVIILTIDGTSSTPLAPLKYAGILFQSFVYDKYKNKGLMLWSQIHKFQNPGCNWQQQYHSGIVLENFLCQKQLYESRTFNRWILAQNCRHLADVIFKYTLLEVIFCILIHISPKFVAKDAINNKPATVQNKACCWADDKPLLEPITHICMHNQVSVCWCVYIMRVTRMLWWLGGN